MDNLKWSLKELYESFESEAFKSDLKKCDKYIEEYKSWVENITKDNEDLLKKLEEYITRANAGEELFSKLFAFSQLTLSVDTKNAAALKSLEILEQKVSGIAEAEAKLKKYIGGIESLSSTIESSKLLKEHEFHFNEIVEGSKYLLSDKEEAVIAKMRNTGSGAWSKLNDLLTSTLAVDIELEGENKQLPLTVIRNMAYEKGGELRKKAYEAELASYKKIEDGVAAALNGIKGEVITVANMRGYRSPLEETLLNSRMDEETLNAMLTAMKESFPAFRKYFRRKGELLGSKTVWPSMIFLLPWEMQI